jgi:hypothetical protein
VITMVQPPDTVRLLLAEYEALRTEIMKRMEIQNQVILFSITALGAILAVAFQSKMPALGLLYPVLATFLATTWAHDDYRASQIGKYIKVRIEQRLGKDAEQRYWIGWEHYMGLPQSRPGSLYRLASVGIFAATELVATAVGLSPLATDPSARTTTLALITSILGTESIPAEILLPAIAALTLLISVTPSLIILRYGAKHRLPPIPSNDASS